MKIAGHIIQNKNIERNSELEFVAKYKGYKIKISSNPEFGEPKFDHLTRFRIEIRAIHGENLEVDLYDDWHTIRDAIRVALKKVSEEILK